MAHNKNNSLVYKPEIIDQRFNQRNLIAHSLKLDQKNNNSNKNNNQNASPCSAFPSSTHSVSREFKYEGDSEDNKPYKNDSFYRSVGSLPLSNLTEINKNINAGVVYPSKHAKILAYHQSQQQFNTPKHSESQAIKVSNSLSPCSSSVGSPITSLDVSPPQPEPFSVSSSALINEPQCGSIVSNGNALSRFFFSNSISNLNYSYNDTNLHQQQQQQLYRDKSPHTSSPSYHDHHQHSHQSQSYSSPHFFDDIKQQQYYHQQHHAATQQRKSYKHIPPHPHHQPPRMINNHHQPHGSPSLTKRPKSTFPFGRCKVCNDKATGVHYGIATCEGCKGFFKRSTLKKEKYRCFFGNNCPLTPDNRNRCKACRFKKCLEVGMSIQGVKMGRIPKAEKERALMMLKDKNNEMLQNKNMSHNIPIANEASEALGHEGLEYDSSSSDTDYNGSESILNNLHMHSDVSSYQNANDSDYGCEENDMENSNECSIVGRFDLGNSGSLVHQSVSQCSLENEINKISLNYKRASFSLQQNLDQYINKKTPDYSSNTNVPSILVRRSLGDLKHSHEEDVSAEGQVRKKRATIDHTPLNQINCMEIMNRQKDDFDPMFTKFFEQKFADALNLSSKSVAKFTISYDENFFKITPLVIDKLDQAFFKFCSPIVGMYKKGTKLIRDGVTKFDGHDADIKDVWTGLLLAIPEFVKDLIAYAKEMPGIAQLPTKDFATIINSTVFELYLVTNAVHYMNDEHFAWLPNGIMYSRAWMNKIIGEEVTNATFAYEADFNDLNLTTREIAILVPYLLTKPKENLEKPEKLKILNEYFLKTILFEFSVNKRSEEFITRWEEIISKLPFMNELSANNIGYLSLTS